MKLMITGLLLMMLAMPSFALSIGRVDIQRVLISVKQGKNVRAKLKKSFDKKQKILKAEESKIKKAQKKFKKQSLVMNMKTKLKKEKEIERNIITLRQKSLEFQKEMQSMEGKLKKPILMNIQEVIKAVSVSAKVDITFEASTAPIVYAKNLSDLTDKVIKAYNKKHK